MTDDRPEPRYGQYAPITTPTVAPTPEPVVAAPEPAPTTLRTRDVIITSVLLLFGVADVASSFATFASFASTINQVYEQFGVTGSADPAIVAPYGLAINIARIVLLVITIAVSLLLISRHRRAFWVPLVGWAVSTVVSSILVALVMLNDPAYMAWLTQQTP